MDNDETEQTMPCEDSAEVILERYERKRTQKADDVAAMQAVLCVLAAAVLIIINLIDGDLGRSLFERLTELANDEKEVVPNIIRLVSGK